MSRLFLLFFLVGCSQKTAATPAGGSAAAGPDTLEESPRAEAPMARDPSVPGVSGGAASSGECPPPRAMDGMCAQVMTWAKNPVSGECCSYSTPCVTPVDWKTFTDERECAAAPTAAKVPSYPDCMLDLGAVCAAGMVDGCGHARPGGEPLTKGHICVPEGELGKVGPSCMQDLARDCPAGQVDACLVQASDIHICVADPR